MTDHFKTLSPQDQTTWISLIKKYRSKRLTEDELKTLNDLNPDFVPELPMPVYTGETIRATMEGEFPTIDDILNAVLTQEQRDQKNQMIGRISEMLSDDQKRRIENGEDIEAVIGELGPLQQSEINKLGYSPMNDAQHQDFIFLMNGIFEDVALDERMAILQHLKNNEGTITANDIMSMAREAQKKGLKGGYFVWLLEHYNEKDLNDFASEIEYAFGTSLTGLTLDHLNAEYMAQHQAEASMLTTMAFANAAGAVVNRWMFGRALAPDEMYSPNSRLDSIERDGTTGKPGGSQEPYTPQRDVGPLENANFAQKTYSIKFSKEGQQIYSKLAGKPIKTIDDLVNAIKNGLIKPSDVPIDYIVRDGNVLILNTRSSQALIQAGTPRNQWNVVNRTGDTLFEGMLTDQLKRNGLSSAGTPTVIMSGGEK